MGTKGYKSTEFWMMLAAIILTTLLSSGVLPTDSLWEKLVTMGVTVLGALGYTIGRSLFKAAKAKSADNK